MAEAIFTTGGFGLGGGGRLLGPSRNLVDIQLLGTPELIAALNAFSGRMQEKGLLALQEIAETIMTRAKRKTPVATGNLRASGHVDEARVEGNMLTVEMGFGGDAHFAGGVTVRGRRGRRSSRHIVNYAVYVHEDLTKHHTVGEAKFLERAALEVIPNMERQMAFILRDELARVAR